MPPPPVPPPQPLRRRLSTKEQRSTRTSLPVSEMTKIPAPAQPRFERKDVPTTTSELASSECSATPAPDVEWLSVNAQSTSSTRSEGEPRKGPSKSAPPPPVASFDVNVQRIRLRSAPELATNEAPPPAVDLLRRKAQSCRTICREELSLRNRPPPWLFPPMPRFSRTTRFRSEGVASTRDSPAPCPWPPRTTKPSRTALESRPFALTTCRLLSA